MANVERRLSYAGQVRSGHLPVYGYTRVQSAVYYAIAVVREAPYIPASSSLIGTHRSLE